MVFFRSVTNFLRNSYLKVVVTGPLKPVQAMMPGRASSNHLLAVPSKYTRITCNFLLLFHLFAVAIFSKFSSHSWASSSGFPRKRVGFAMVDGPGI